MLKKNENILNNWIETVKKYPKINFKEAKELNSQIQKETNLGKKSMLRDRLIKGTLYVLIDYIKAFDGMNVEGKTYDINDIISSSTEAWIKLLDQNVLEEVKSFKSVFAKKYYEIFCESLTGENPIKNNYEMRKNKIVKYIYVAMNFYKKNGRLSLDDFIAIVKQISKNDYYIIKKYINSIYLIALKIIGMNIKYNDKEISERKFNFISQVIIENAINLIFTNDDESYSNKGQTRTLENEVISGTLKEEMLKLLDTLTPREKDVLMYRYGFIDGKIKTILDTGKRINSTGERARQIEAKALRKLRHSHSAVKIKDYIK